LKIHVSVFPFEFDISLPTFRHPWWSHIQNVRYFLPCAFVTSVFWHTPTDRPQVIHQMAARHSRTWDFGRNHKPFSDLHAGLACLWQQLLVTHIQTYIYVLLVSGVVLLSDIVGHIDGHSSQPKVWNDSFVFLHDQLETFEAITPNKMANREQNPALDSWDNPRSASLKSHF